MLLLFPATKRGDKPNGFESNLAEIMVWDNTGFCPVKKQFLGDFTQRQAEHGVGEP
jgi:hypothetical protein